MPCFKLASGVGFLGVPGWLRQLSVGPLVSAHDHDRVVCGFEPPVGLCADRAEPAWDSLSLSLSLSLRINK